MIGKWKEKQEIQCQICKDIKSALSFKDTSLTQDDLVKLFGVIKKLNKDNKKIRINEIITKSGYVSSDCLNLIERLKKLGEVYDPFLEKKDEGIYLQII
ncbi:hypothetical protein K9M79_01800 [Candidatus Woesearchaeota archaeon]|nr:hypothetical protein [Candidatus Woesearchaeota archaeon]